VRVILELCIFVRIVETSCVTSGDREHSKHVGSVVMNLSQNCQKIVRCWEAGSCTVKRQSRRGMPRQTKPPAPPHYVGSLVCQVASL
jgi:hypothetical protein